MIRQNPFLQLIRPANTLTAACDILAGASVAGFLVLGPVAIPVLITLCLSSMLLYAGGISLNDVCDADIDAKERPSRPIPSGKVSRQLAFIYSMSLSFLGIGLALYSTLFTTSRLSGIFAILVAVTAGIYNKWAKHHAFWGPLSMGLCRGFNLLLGMSILELSAITSGWMMLLPILFIFGITLTSQGEVHGNNKRSLVMAMGMDLFLLSVLLFLMMKNTTLEALPFILLWYGLNLFTKLKAIQENTSRKIMLAVKYGVLSLVPLNAAYSALHHEWGIALIILAFFPVSFFISKYFSVT